MNCLASTFKYTLGKPFIAKSKLDGSLNKEGQTSKLVKNQQIN
jgi:hypothetical protein